jgi:tetratricopeptide (TPR) repeat protein
MGAVSIRLVVPSLAFCLLVLCPAQQHYVGAEGALKAINVKPAAQPPSYPQWEFQRSIDAYQRAAPRLVPIESARRWLSLAEKTTLASDTETLTLPQGASLDFELLEVMRTLPSPRVWPAIEAILAKRTGPWDRAMLGMFQALLGDRGAAKKQLELVTKLSPARQALLAYIRVDLTWLDENKAGFEEAFLKLADSISAAEHQAAAGQFLELPNLEARLGTDRARALLRTLVRKFDGELVLPQGATYGNLAREIALAEADHMKHPQWNLAIDVDGGPLFEAIHKRFPDVSSGIQRSPDWGGDSAESAAWRYLAWLVATGREGDAGSYVKNNSDQFQSEGPLPDEEIAFLKKAGKVDGYLRFLETSISRGAGFASAYKMLCDTLHEPDRAQEFLAKLPEKQRLAAGDPIEDTLTTLLARRKVVEAGEFLENLIKSPPPKDRQGGPIEHPESDLVDFGHYLHRQDLIDEGIAAAEKKLASDDSFEQGWVCEELADDHRGVEAERLIANSLKAAFVSTSSSSPPEGQEQCQALVQLYVSLGRFDDALTVLDRGTRWGERDVAFVDSPDERENSLSFLTARALAGVGRTAEALHVLKYVLQSHQDLDQAYELLLRLDSRGAGPMLDAMHRVSPFATRPLIWKAELLRRSGRLDEAGHTTRQSPSIRKTPRGPAAIQDSWEWRSWHGSSGPRVTTRPHWLIKRCLRTATSGGSTISRGATGWISKGRPTRSKDWKITRATSIYDFARPASSRNWASEQRPWSKSRKAASRSCSTLDMAWGRSGGMTTRNRSPFAKESSSMPSGPSRTTPDYTRF